MYFAEINTDYTDPNGVTYIDGYTLDSDVGKVIGYFINGEVYYTDNEYQFIPIVAETVSLLKKEYKPLTVQEKYESLAQEVTEEIWKIRGDFPIIEFGIIKPVIDVLEEEKMRTASVYKISDVGIWVKYTDNGAEDVVTLNDIATLEDKINLLEFIKEKIGL